MSQENVELVRRAVEALNRGDVKAMSASLSPDAEIFPLRATLEDVSYTGPAAAEQLWAALSETWSEIRIDVDEYRDLGERVLMLGWTAATARDSGAAVRSKMGWLLDVTEDQITRSRTFADPGDALAAVGLSD